MGGAEAQAGIYYQNLVGAEYALKLIEPGSSLRALLFDNPTRAEHIDDIIAESVEQTSFVQVKWSRNQASTLTLKNMSTPEDDSVSLLRKLAQGFGQVANERGEKEIILLSTRKPGTSRQPGSGFDKSLTEFIAEFHEPFRDDPSCVDIRESKSFTDYASILNQLKAASAIEELAEFSRFLKCLRFRLGQPDLDTTTGRVRARLAQLGVAPSQYAILVDAVVNWSINRQRVTSTDVLRVLGLLDRFQDQVGHHFPVDTKVWVPTPQLFAALDSSIGSLEDGFVLLEGEPGSGKSTALAVYLSRSTDVLFGYYCFVPDDRTIGNARLGDDAFLHSICSGLKNAFPDVEFPRPYAQHTKELLNAWLGTLSSAKRRVVFVVDRLDHVDRKTRQSLVARPLTTVLDGTLPPHVLIVLNSRYPEALPAQLIEHVRGDPRRHVQMPAFDRAQIREFLRLRAVGLADNFLDRVANASGGIPIYLEYLAEQLAAMSPYEQERYLDSVPVLRDRRIDGYHQHLWEELRGDPTLVYAFAFLAARDEFTSPEVLLEFLDIVGARTTLHDVHNALKCFRHVLRVAGDQSVTIRHSSLSEFVAEKTEHLRDQITRTIVEWYGRHPGSDEAWRHRFRHLVQIGENAAVLDACDDDWLVSALADRRPLHEIQRNLNVAWRAASETRDLVRFVRIGLMKQEVAVIRQNLSLSGEELAEFLLDIGQPDKALRQVWDGERRQCTSVEFATFCLHHFKRLGRDLPERLIELGLGNGPDPGADFEGTKTWYRARTHTGNPVPLLLLPLLLRVQSINWRTQPRDGHLRDSLPNSESERMNLDIQLAMVSELDNLSDPSAALNLLSSTECIPGPVRTAACVSASLILARAGATAEASSALRGLDISDLPRSTQRSLFLRLAACGLDAAIAPIAVSQPSLPTSLVESPALETPNAVFELFDILRLFFLRHSGETAWFETATKALVGPVKPCVLAIGGLAQLWANSTLNVQPDGAKLTTLKRFVAALDVPSMLFREVDDFGEHAYRRNAHRLFEQAWSCATDILCDSDVVLLAQWWTSRDQVECAERYREATLALADMVCHRLKVSGDNCIRGLLVSCKRKSLH